MNTLSKDSSLYFKVGLVPSIHETVIGPTVLGARGRSLLFSAESLKSSRNPFVVLEISDAF